MELAKIFKTSALLLTAMLMMIGSVNLYAQEMPLPQKLVKDASDKMLAALAENEVELEEDPSKIYSLVEDIFFSRGMAQLNF